MFLNGAGAPAIPAIVIVPVYVPALSPVGFTCTLSGAGAVPEDAESNSHAALYGEPVTATVKAAAVGTLVTCSVCTAGSAVAPSRYWNVSVAGAAVMVFAVCALALDIANAKP